MFLLGSIIYFFVIAFMIWAIDYSFINPGNANWNVAKIMSAFIVVTWFILGSIFLSTVGTLTETVTDSYEISAMRDSSSIVGHGTLFFASVGPDLSINYMQVNQDGSVSPQSLSSSKDIRIYEGDYEPKIQKVFVSCEPGENLLRRMFIGPRICPVIGGEIRYEIYLPEGSIINQFELDLN